MNIQIDFETRCQLDIKQVGAWAYSAHPSCEILCMSVKEDDNPTFDIVGEIEIAKYLTKRAMDIKCFFIAFNAFFERSIWENCLTKRHGVPRVPINRWECTMAIAAAHGISAGLDLVGEYLDLPVKKDAEGKRLMLKLSKTKKGSPIDLKDMVRLCEYCRIDTDVSYEIYKMLGPLPMAERILWVLDQRINDKGFRIDKKLLAGLDAVANQLSDYTSKEIKQLTGGRVEKVSGLPKIKKIFEEHGYPVKSLDKEATANLLANPTLPKLLKEILELRVLGGKTSVKKIDKFKSYIQDSDIIRGTLMYHGARTGRWTASGIQPHNLPKGIKLTPEQEAQYLKDFKTKTPEELLKQFGKDTGMILSTFLRRLIIPPDGEVIIDTDFSAIEARIVLWLSECEHGVELFRQYDAGQGEDVYVQMARLIYGDKTLTKKGNPAERNLGKQAVLGCGYGMGKEKFKDTCAKFGIDIPQSMADKAVDTYRGTFKEVKQFWYDIEKAAITAFQTGRPIQCKRIRVTCNSEWLKIRLPSGRYLSYRKPQLAMVTTSWGKQKLELSYLQKDPKRKGFLKRQKTYGGLLTENICQAIARDIMAHSMLNLHRHGFDTILTIHDETVEYCKKDKTVEEKEKLMLDKPQWASELPLAVESEIWDRFKK